MERELMDTRKNNTKKMILCFSCLLAVVVLACGPALAWEAPKIDKPANYQDYPKHPIDFICGWGVGGGADIMTRKLAELAHKYYGMDFVVTNMPGAAGVKGIDYSMRQPKFDRKSM